MSAARLVRPSAFGSFRAHYVRGCQEARADWDGSADGYNLDAPAFVPLGATKTGPFYGSPDALVECSCVTRADDYRPRAK